jgi:hypothetical protein
VLPVSLLIVPELTRVYMPFVGRERE